MTFDNRARRAAQGIRRAVEVMEMSSTKTSQRLTRFDEFRERKSRNQRLAAALVGAGVALLLVVGAVLLRSDGGTKPAGQPTVTLGPDHPEVFEPAFTYSLPDGWEVTGDADRFYAMRQIGTTDRSTGIYVLRNVVAASPDCSDQPKAGVGTSASAMTSWLSRHPGLDRTSPQQVTIGGAPGYQMDIALFDSWSHLCGLGDVPLFTGQPAGDETWAIAPGERMRVTVLDLPIGGTVTIVAEADSPTQFEPFMTVAAPIVGSFDFRV